MSNSTVSVTSIAESDNGNFQYEIQYACGSCNNVFTTEKLCADHAIICPTKYTLQDNVQIFETKRLSNGCNETRNNETVIESDCNELNDDTDQNNESDSELYEFNLFNTNAQDTKNCNNRQYSKTSGSNDGINRSRQLSENNKNVKMLTVLNPVGTSGTHNEKTRRKNHKDNSKIKKTTSHTNEDPIFCDTTAEEHKCKNSLECTTDPLTETNINTSQVENMKITVNPKNLSNSDANNKSKEHQRMKDMNRKWYQKINHRSKIDEPETIIGVYDFYDEEEEKLNMEKIKSEECAKDLKERTCKFCREIFDDPMEVLRHKRKAHQFSKILMTKAELAPYFKMNTCENCPICHKPFGKKVYKSKFHSHLMTHCNNEVYQCTICGRQFKRIDHKRIHESRHIVAPD